MAEVFISYSRVDLDWAVKIKDALERLEISVWYDKNTKPGEDWNNEVAAQLKKARVVLTLWSSTSSESEWVRFEANFGAKDRRLVSATIEPCNIPPPHGGPQAVVLDQWNGDTSAAEYLDLIELLADKLQRSELMDFAAYRRVKRAPGGVEQRRRTRHYSFRDMLDLCDKVRDDVRHFNPDVIVCTDSRGGIWAEMMLETLTDHVPVLIGMRMRHTEPHKDSALYEAYACLNTSRWKLFMPPALTSVPPTSKVLFIDDYSRSGDTCTAFRAHLEQTLGFPPEKIKTLALIKSAHAPPENAPDIYGVLEDAENIDLFYMFER